MKTCANPLRWGAFLVFACATLTLSADVIDPYTAPQGPFTVGPNEEIPEEDAVVFTDSVLGGFRVAAPVMGDDAASGSTATLNINGGVFVCSLDFPNVDPVNNNGGCAGGYDRGEDEAFDLSGSTRFIFDVQAVQGGMSLGVTLVDINEDLSVGRVENVSPGQVSLPFDQLFHLTNPAGVDLGAIDNIGIAIINSVGQEGSVTLGEFSTDGPIGDGPSGPPGGGGDIAAREISGNYFNPLRDGEGCQLTLERDGVTFILTCYFYNDGKQFWIIGVGLLEDGQIVFGDMTITTGADYGGGFDPADVARESWGSVIMSWADCNNATLELLPVLPGYEQTTLVLTRVIPTLCGGGGPQGDSVDWMGAYFGPLRDGEGFQLAAEGDGSIWVITFYTYLNGEQVWLIGAGARDGDRLTFSNVVITSGADFGSEFDPADVQREFFGEIIADFSDCNNFTATVDSALPEFEDIVLDVTKIVPGACP